KYLKTKQSAIITPNSSQVMKVCNSLPYKLTQDQDKAVKDVLKDMASGTQMMRIVQGDVGCGKTSIAIITAILCALDSTRQIAIMCPTEALANQHANTFSQFLDQFGISSTYLGGSTKAKVKTQIYKELSN